MGRPGVRPEDDLRRIDAAIAALEARIDAIGLEEALEGATRAALDLIGLVRPVPAEAGLLEAFRILVKGDPTWNAVRDNLRELVYYRNCLEAGREDALPPVPQKMAVRLARHLFLYFSGRL